MNCLWCGDGIDKLFKGKQVCDSDCLECYEIVIEGKNSSEGIEINFQYLDEEKGGEG